jgi:hypothetical protein
MDQKNTPQQRFSAHYGHPILDFPSQTTRICGSRRGAIARTAENLTLRRGTAGGDIRGAAISCGLRWGEGLLFPWFLRPSSISGRPFTASVDTSHAWGVQNGHL